MKLIKKHQFPNGGTLLVGKVSSSIQYLTSSVILTDQEQVKFQTIKSEKRQLEWLGTRWLIQHFYGSNVQINYHDNGCPYLSPLNYFISISHSDKMIALLIHPHLKTGIDIQSYSPRKIQRIAKKFIAPAENKFCSYTDVNKLHIIWAAKEALFKYHSDGNLDFREHLYIEPFDEQHHEYIYGHIRTSEYRKRIKLKQEKSNNCFLVYTL